MAKEGTVQINVAIPENVNENVRRAAEDGSFRIKPTLTEIAAAALLSWSHLNPDERKAALVRAYEESL